MLSQFDLTYIAAKWIDSGAIYSPCQRYRYVLWRHWSTQEARKLCFLLLNPSTATEHRNDPTVERCERRARAMNYGGMIVLNLFAWRSTDPAAMRKAIDPVGPENDRHIKEWVKKSEMILCGWGSHGRHLGRSNAVRRMLSEMNIDMRCLRLNQDGEPGHPLYISYDAPVLNYTAELVKWHMKL